MASIRVCFVVSLLLASLLVLASATYNGDDYGSKDKPQKAASEKSRKFLSTNIGVQGLVYCKSASDLIPLEGAVTRVTCEAVDEYGFETTPLTFLSGTTDEKGYFLATLSPLEVKGKKMVKQCKAYLDLSSSPNCNEPTDLNKGITGAFLRFDRFLNHNNMNLFTVGPFMFTSLPPN